MMIKLRTPYDHLRDINRTSKSEQNEVYELYLIPAEFVSASRLFSTKRNIPRGAEFFFVCELSSRTNSKKTKKISAPRGIFRKTVENRLYGISFYHITLLSSRCTPTVFDTFVRTSVSMNGNRLERKRL